MSTESMGSGSRSTGSMITGSMGTGSMSGSMSTLEPGSPDTDAGGTGTDVLDRELEQLVNDELTEDGDHDRFSHYVQKEKIVESAVTGKPVIALCGKVWVPGRDPEKFPVCPDCKKIYDRMK